MAGVSRGRRRLGLVVAALTMVLVLVVLAGGAMAQGQATDRELTDAEREMVEAAILRIWASGDVETARALDEWLRAGKIKAGLNLPQGSDGEASARGDIFLRPEILREPASEREKTRAVYWLASLLIHELVHARDQAPLLTGRLRRLYPMDERRRASDWNGSRQSNAACYGPDACEVEAYYRQIEALMSWLLDAYDSYPDVRWIDFTDPDHLQWLEEFRERRRMRIEVLEDLIDSLLDHLRDLNYEKEGWLRDTIAGIDRPFRDRLRELRDDFEREEWEIEFEEEMISRERAASRWLEVRARLEGLFGREGPYARAREAAREAAQAAARRRARPPQDEHHYHSGQMAFDELDSVALLIEASDDEAVSVDMFLIDSGPAAPHGFTFADIEGTECHLVRIDVEGEGADLLLSLVLAADQDLTAGQPVAYSFGTTSPTRWIPIPEQTFDPETGVLEIPVTEGGIIAVLVPNPSYWDLPAGHEIYREAEWLRSQRIMRGMGGGMLGVGMPLKRAEFAALLVRALELTTVAEHAYEDVPADAWYALEHVVGTASAHRLIRGVSSTRFAPEMHITREQAYTVLVRAVNLEQRALGLEEGEIVDLLSSLGDGAKVSPWARPYMAAAIMVGLWSYDGQPAGQDYTGDMCREEAARALYDLFTGLGRIRVAFGQDDAPE